MKNRFKLLAIVMAGVLLFDSTPFNYVHLNEVKAEEDITNNGVDESSESSEENNGVEGSSVSSEGSSESSEGSSESSEENSESSEGSSANEESSESSEGSSESSEESSESSEGNSESSEESSESSEENSESSEESSESSEETSLEEMSESDESLSEEESESETESETETESEENSIALLSAGLGNTYDGHKYILVDTADDDIARGFTGDTDSPDAEWCINASGELYAKGEGTLHSGQYALWYENRGSITSAIIDVQNIPNLSYLFYCSTKVKSIDFTTSTLKDSCTSMVKFADNAISLESVNMSMLDLNNIESTYYSFYSCDDLVSIDFGNNSFGACIDASYMFNGCKSLSNISMDSSIFNACTNASYMFQDCSSLSALPFTSTSFNNVTNALYMFYNCAKINEINLNFECFSNVQNAYNMFSDCYGATSINLGDNKFSNVTNASGMFYNCKNATSIIISDNSFNNVKDASGMFSGCKGISDIPFNSTSLQNITKASNMFYSCSSITEANLYSEVFSNVTTISSIFRGCTSLASVTLCDLNVCRDMGCAFYGCTSLTNVTFGDCSNVTKVEHMFRGCTSLQNVILPNFPNVSDATYMFCDCTSLQNEAVPAMPKLTVAKGMFVGCTSLQSVSFENISNVQDASSMFSKCANLEEIDLSKLITPTLTDISGIFSGCTKFNKDISILNYSNVTDMSYAFAKSGLLNVDLSNINMCNIQRADGAFRGSNIETIKFDNTDLRSLNIATEMFSECNNLTNVSFKDCDLSSLQKCDKMFQSCAKLTDVNFTNVPLNNVTTMESMFEYCKELETLDLSGQTFSSLKNTKSMFRYCTKLNSLNMSNGEDIVDTNITFNNRTFENLSECTGMFAWSGVERVNLGNVTFNSTVDISAFFANCSNLTYCDMSNCVFQQVGNTCKELCFNCTNLVEFRMFNGNFISMSDALYWCRNLINFCGPTIGVSVGTSESGISCMFNGCSAIKSIDLSKFDLSLCKSMDMAFMDCISLTEIVFGDEKKTNLVKPLGIFIGCTSLEYIDLSSFEGLKDSGWTDTYPNERLSCCLFAECYNLKKIKCPVGVTTDIPTGFDINNIAKEMYEDGDVTKPSYTMLPKNLTEPIIIAIPDGIKLNLHFMSVDGIPYSNSCTIECMLDSEGMRPTNKGYNDWFNFYRKHLMNRNKNGFSCLKFKNWYYSIGYHPNIPGEDPINTFWTTGDFTLDDFYEDSCTNARVLTDVSPNNTFITINNTSRILDTIFRGNIDGYIDGYESKFGTRDVVLTDIMLTPGYIFPNSDDDLNVEVTDKYGSIVNKGTCYFGWSENYCKPRYKAKVNGVEVESNWKWGTECYDVRFGFSDKIDGEPEAWINNGMAKIAGYTLNDVEVNYVDGNTHLLSECGDLDPFMSIIRLKALLDCKVTIKEDGKDDVILWIRQGEELPSEYTDGSWYNTTGDVIVPTTPDSIIVKKPMTLIKRKIYCTNIHILDLGLNEIGVIPLYWAKNQWGHYEIIDEYLWNQLRNMNYDFTKKLQYGDKEVTEILGEDSDYFIGNLWRIPNFHESRNGVSGDESKFGNVYSTVYFGQYKIIKTYEKAISDVWRSSIEDYDKILTDAGLDPSFEITDIVMVQEISNSTEKINSNKSIGEIFVKNHSQEGAYDDGYASCYYDNSEFFSVPHYKYKVGGVTNSVNWADETEGWTKYYGKIKIKLTEPSKLQYPWESYRSQNKLKVKGYSSTSFNSEPDITYFADNTVDNGWNYTLKDYVDNNWVLPLCMINDKSKFIYPVVDFIVKFKFSETASNPTFVEKEEFPPTWVRNKSEIGDKLPSGYIWKDFYDADVDNHTVITEPTILFGIKRIDSSFTVSLPSAIQLISDGKGQMVSPDGLGFDVTIRTEDKNYCVNLNAELNELTDRGMTLKTELEQEKSLFGLNIKDTISAVANEDRTYSGTSAIKITAPEKVGDWSGKLQVTFNSQRNQQIPSGSMTSNDTGCDPIDEFILINGKISDGDTYGYAYTGSKGTDNYKHTLEWRINSSGELLVKGSGDLVNVDRDGRSYWYDYESKITSAIINVQNITKTGYMPDVSVIDLRGSTFAKNANADNMFKYCRTLTTLHTDANMFDNITSAKYMFSCCNVPDLSNQKFSSLKNAYGMFSSSTINCTFPDDAFCNVENANYMFAGLKGISDDALKNCTFRNAVDCSYMFNEENSSGVVDKLNLSKATFENAKNCYSMFGNIRYINGLDLSNATFENAENCQYMFTELGYNNDSSDDYEPFDIVLPKATFNSCKNAYYFMNYAKGVKSVSLPEATFDSCENPTYMFDYCNSLEAVSLPKATFSSATSIDKLCYNNNVLKSISMPSATFENVTSALSAFGTNPVLASLNLDSATFDNVTSISSFLYKAKLNEVDFPKATFKSLTSPLSMFNGLSEVEEINLPEATFESATSFYGMFCNCQKLKRVYLPKFVGGGITQMSYNFDSDVLLEELDLSSLDLSQLPNTNQYGSKYYILSYPDVCGEYMSNMAIKKFKTPINVTGDFGLPVPMVEEGTTSPVYTTIPKNLDHSITLVAQ